MAIITNGAFSMKAYFEGDVLYFWTSLNIGEHELQHCCSKYGIGCQKVKGLPINKYVITLPSSAKVRKIDKENVEILIYEPRTVITAYTATCNSTSDIDECEFEDFFEYMMEKTAQDDSELEWNQEAHTIKISISCLYAIYRHLKRWPLKEAIGPHTYGEMASLFKGWLDASEGKDGRFVVIHCEDKYAE